MLIRRTNLGRHSVQAWGGKTVWRDVLTPTSVHCIADFVTPVRLKLLVKQPVRKVAEVNLQQVSLPPTLVKKRKKSKKKVKRKCA